MTFSPPPAGCSVLKFKEIHKAGEVNVPGAGDARAADTETRYARLLRLGAKALSNSELVALVLGPEGAVSAHVLASQLMDRWGSLIRLSEVKPQWLCRIRGMGLTRAARLAAAFELAARCGQPMSQCGWQVKRPQDLRALLFEEFRGCDREHFLALYLDTRHRIQAVETVSVGSLNASLVHPREVFKPAVAWSAAAVIVAHNHPSGCASPSSDDLDLTARLISCGRLLGIELLDHIIVAGRELLSLREHGWPEAETGSHQELASTEG